ncbi:predicted protein [Naegleria gruberi]|uniref:Predicted protein n=1 Tax=Naegleria gruberi TaxID=5762 RepID=D2VMV1_NAEGR|nr:uncharacterized protein NAEGRDRAFT_70270 [Naegleria gruberi]EFC41806.1 predicted protein [Naegleria gruberi]|eukprot:XP_002674550.1 predicted protein [Naegleria gruberi strain NEG-M]
MNANNRNDPLTKLQNMAKTESIRRLQSIQLGKSNFESPSMMSVGSPNNIHSSPVSQDFAINPAVEQLTDWKNQFNDRLSQVQEELLMFLTQKHVSQEELAILIKNTFSDFKISISELLNTLTLLMKKFLKKSKKLVQTADSQWEVIVLDLNNQLEHVSRARAVEEEKRKELEKEVKMLRQKMKSMKIEMVKPKEDQYQQLVNSIQSNPSSPVAKARGVATPKGSPTRTPNKSPRTPAGGKKPLTSPKTKTPAKPAEEPVVTVEPVPVVTESPKVEESVPEVNEPEVVEPPKEEPPKEEPPKEETTQVEPKKDEEEEVDEKDSRRDRRGRRGKKDDEEEEEEKPTSRRDRGRGRRGKKDDEEEEEKEEEKEERGRGRPSRRNKKKDEDEEEEEEEEKPTRRVRDRGDRRKRNE